MVRGTTFAKGIVACSGYHQSWCREDPINRFSSVVTVVGGWWTVLVVSLEDSLCHILGQEHLGDISSSNVVIGVNSYYNFITGRFPLLDFFFEVV